MIMMPYGPLDDFGGPGETDPREPELVFEGKDTLILTVGNKFGAAKEAANRLGAGLVNIRQLKPLPEQRLLQLIAPYQHLVTIEEAVLDGGMGSALAALLTDYDKKKELLRIGLPCDFIEPGSNDELCQKYDLDAKGLYSRIVERWPNLIAKLDETS